MITKLQFMLDRPEHLDARRQRTHTETVAAIDPWAPADPVGEALHFLRMNGAFYCRSELSAPWGLTLPPMPGYLWFHVVSSGRVWLETGAADPALLQHGDLALVPHGEGHALRSEPGVQAPGILELEREQVSERYEILRHGEGGVPTTLICDSMAGQVMKEGCIQAVVVGADRIAANGDAANKIGTYSVAVLARAHDIPFYVAAPSSTFDFSLPSGEAIPIEIRASEEITEGFGRRTAPRGVDAYNPAFDVTPAKLITGIITERGVIRPVNAETVQRLLRSV